MALRYLGLADSLKLQKSNEKPRRLDKISIFLQDLPNEAEVVKV
jgi:hypothetical protein